MVLPDGPTARGAATSWRAYLVWVEQAALALPLVENQNDDLYSDEETHLAAVVGGRFGMDEESADFGIV
jgi:hypothetical protein